LQLTLYQAKPEQEDELTTQVAAPPKVTSKVQSIKELSSTTSYQLPTTKDIGVDISLLSKVLSPQEQVIERDEAWEFDSLFVTVTSELQQELEQEEEAKRKESEEKEDDDQNANGLNTNK
jgi:hypothetical protein